MSRIGTWELINHIDINKKSQKIGYKNLNQSSLRSYVTFDKSIYLS